jgi:hypothetical protein
MFSRLESIALLLLVLWSRLSVSPCRVLSGSLFIDGMNNWKVWSPAHSFVLLLVGWDCGHFWPIVPAPDDRWGWLWSNWWNEDWQWKPKYSEKTCPSATWSTTNPTWPDPGEQWRLPEYNASASLQTSGCTDNPRAYECCDSEDCCEVVTGLSPVSGR